METRVVIMNEDKVSRLRYLKESVPNILASISIPLLGMAAIAVIGNLNNAQYMAGITVGTQILDTIYWIFGNIKFVASGQSAQALGLGNRKERLNALLQPLLLSLIIYVFLVLFQNPIFDLFNSFIKPEEQVAQAAGIYYHILIFSSFLFWQTILSEVGC